MPGAAENSITEGWGSYRKLIIDTLRRLDEGTHELAETQNEHDMRILTLENKKTDEHFIKVEADIKSNNEILLGVKKALDSASTQIKLLISIGGLAWTIVVAIFAAWMGHIFK